MPRPAALLAFLVVFAPLQAQDASVKELRKQLKSKEASERALAAEALAGMGPEAASAASALAPLLSDPNKSVRENAARALALTGKGKRYVTKALGKRESQLGAVHALGYLGEDAIKLLPKVAKLWRNESMDLRNEIQAAMVRLGKPAVPFLVRTLPDRLTGIYAARCLGSMKKDAIDAVPALIQVLEYEPSFTQPNAADALGRIGDPSAIPALTAILSKMGKKDSHWDSLGTHCADALRELGPEASSAVDSLVSVCELTPYGGDFSDFRIHAVSALQAIGVRSEAVLEVLRNLAVEDSDIVVEPRGIVEHARTALQTLDPSNGTSESRLLTTARFHRSPEIRARSLKKLAERKPNSKLVNDIARLAEKCAYQEVRLSALDMLGTWGPKARPAAKILIRLAESEDAELAAAVKEALAKIR